MVEDTTTSSEKGSVVLDRWSARRVQPAVVFYVVAVFAVFIAVSHFVFHSTEAVKALAIAALGAVAATVPSVMGKIEYRATASGIEKRTLDAKKPAAFEEALRWDELSRVVPMRRGFKYYRATNETNPARRFWKTHVSDRFSGEIHVERQDLGRILGIVEQQCGGH